MTSRLTDAQLRAAIESSDATARKHEMAGKPKLAAEALLRASRNREELRRREGLTQDPKEAPAAAPSTPTPAARPAPIPIPLETHAPYEAELAAEGIVKTWGATIAVRAMVDALNKHTSLADSMDISEAPRVIAMQARYAQ
jgi:hypothetical protein